MFILLFLFYSLGDIKDFWDGLNRVSGPTGFEILQLDMDARINATGGNSLEKGISSLLLNPAELTSVNSKYCFTFSYRPLFCEMNANFVGFTLKRENEVFGFYYLGFYSGEIPLQDKTPGVSVASYYAENIIFGLSYARSFGNWSLGGTIKTLRERIFEVSYLTYSFDLGMSYNFSSSINPFRVDFSFLHLGPKYGPQNFEKVFRLPLTWHLGFNKKTGSLSFGSSLNKPLNTKLQCTFGGEYRFGDYFVIRFGKKYNNPLEKGSFGFGLIRNKIALNYSYYLSQIEDFEGAHIFTISIGT